MSYGTDSLPATIKAEPDNQNGQMKVILESVNNTSFLGTFTIRRTSSKTNFHKWEDIHNVIFLQDAPINLTWNDYTVESGVYYKYCIQKRYSNGSRGTAKIIDNPVMCYFEDIFLNDGKRQLKVQFNPTVADFKYNVTESQQITIGSQYPYIKRNSKNYYRTFNLNGLISSFMDEDNWYNEHGVETKNQPWTFDENVENHFFTNKTEIYQDSEALYANYNEDNNISYYQDYIYEKKFRDKVYEFLYENNIKLFRSTT